MRRRLFFYYTISVLAALLALLLVSGGVTHVVSKNYLKHTLSAMDARSLQIQEILNDWTPSPETWGELNDQLQEMGYDLHVSEGKKQIFSSLGPLQSRLLRQSEGLTLWPEGGAVSLQNDGILMIGLHREGYTIVSMPKAGRPDMWGQQLPHSELAMITLLISGAAAIVVIVLLSLAFTNRRIKQVLRPVNALVSAAKRVEQGNYSEPIDYHGQDEFDAVCLAFDHMQQHLLAQQEKNLAYERARTDLIAGISHDLRTPLTSVKGYIKGLRDGVANTPEKQLQYLDVAYRKACAMDIMLQRLFYFSKLETGNLPIHFERADLGRFVSRFAEDVRGDVEAKGGRMTVAVSPGDHPIRVDTEQMYRVLLNLTDNAQHYAQAEQLELTLSVWQEGNTHRLRFSDNGGGVPEEQLPHLFERFWRGSQARESRDGDNSGLGLYIAKYIVEIHGGSISVENGQGLTFEIVLPREEKKPDAEDLDCGR